MNRQTEIRENLNKIWSQLGSANLIAVSKYTSVEDIVFAINSGQYDFGESRVQDMAQKASDLKILEKELKVSQADVLWHFIGNLQVNKLNNLLKIKNLKYIHSIGSMKLLQELLKREERFSYDLLYYFLQVNTSGEEEKTGFENFEELSRAIEFINENPCQKFELLGLMTMGKLRTDDFEKDARLCFSKLKSYQGRILKEFNLNLKLSMGMSSDYNIAVQEGADYVRIGSAIFS